MVRVLVLLVLSCLFGVPTARAQIFLELVGETQGPILGDATFAGEANRIDVSSLNQGQWAFYASGGGSGSVVRGRSAVTLSKIWDSSSIKLLRAQGEGEKMTKCVFRIYRMPAVAIDPLERRMPMEENYLTIVLTGARIESYSASGQGSQKLEESLTITFDEISYTYVPTGATFVDVARGAPAGNTLARPRDLDAGVTDDGFTFVLPATGSVGIDVVDAQGRWVTTLIGDDATLPGGIVRWDATDAAGRKVPAGVYTATVRTSGAEITRKMVVGEN